MHYESFETSTREKTLIQMILRLPKGIGYLGLSDTLGVSSIETSKKNGRNHGKIGA